MAEETGKQAEPGADMQNPKSKTPRWIKLVLVASLGLNIAVAGVVGGALLRADKGKDRAKLLQGRDFGFAPYITAFEEDERRELGRNFLRQSGGIKAARDEVRTSFAMILQSLEADPFDAAQFEALLTAQQAALASRQGLGAALIAEKVAQMSTEERAAFAQRLEENLKRGPRRPGPNGPRGDKSGGAQNGPKQP